MNLFLHKDIPDTASEINGVFLPCNTIWLGYRQEKTIGQVGRRALSGVLHRYQRPIAETGYSGRTIALKIAYAAGDPSSSWLSEEKYQELKLLADVPAASYTFRWAVYNVDTQTDDFEEYDVSFDHSAVALDFQRLQGNGNIPHDLGLWSGQINLNISRRIL